MPIYEFECTACGVFPAFRSIEERNLPTTCLFCDQPAPRVITAPNLSLMSPRQRMAATRNERSRHQPLVANGGACCSGGSCTHRKPAEAKTRDGKPALRASRKKNRRPWMLGH